LLRCGRQKKRSGGFATRPHCLAIYHQYFRLCLCLHHRKNKFSTRLCLCQHYFNDFFKKPIPLSPFPWGFMKGRGYRKRGAEAPLFLSSPSPFRRGGLRG